MCEGVCWSQMWNIRVTGLVFEFWTYPPLHTALRFPGVHFSHLENGVDVRTSFISWCEEQKRSLALCLENSKYRIILAMMIIRMLVGDLVVSLWVSHKILSLPAIVFLLQNDEACLSPLRDPIPKSL